MSFCAENADRRTDFAANDRSSQLFDWISDTRMDYGTFFLAKNLPILRVNGMFLRRRNMPQVGTNPRFSGR